MTVTRDPLLDQLLQLPDQVRRRVLARLTPAERSRLDHYVARMEQSATVGRVDLLDHQRPPDGPWDGWLLLGGRGSGKSYAVTRWLAKQARERPGLRGRIIAPTLDDAVLSCVEGPSGILAADPTATYHPSVPGGSRVQWPNGSVVWPRGTPTPRSVDRLRALTNIDVDVFEEAAANPQLASAVEQAALSRRRAGARWAASTTPRAVQTIRDWLDAPDVVAVRATSHDNPYLDAGWRDRLVASYEGTRLYRQEVLGELLDDVEGARWRYDWLDRSRVTELPDGVPLRWAVGVDPAAGSGTTGIVAVAADPDGRVYVTDDASTAGGPGRWAANVRELATLRDATIVAERDQGGRMVREVLEAAGVQLPVKAARARSVGSKQVRADAVAILWEQQPPAAHLVGTLPQLEDQLTSWVPDDRNAPSPDRLDAMVWAVLWLRTTAHRPTTVTVPSGTFGGW